MDTARHNMSCKCAFRFLVSSVKRNQIAKVPRILEYLLLEYIIILNTNRETDSVTRITVVYYI